MMDFSTDAPFWKAEERDGDVTWVDARESDNTAWCPLATGLRFRSDLSLI